MHICIPYIFYQQNRTNPERYTYADRTNYLTRLDYGNGDNVQYEYDDMGRTVKQTYEDGASVSYQYDNNGALATVTDSETGITTTYYYDFTDRLMKFVESGDGYNHSIGYEYDQLNNLTSIVDTINGTERTTSYAYDDDNRIESVTNGSAEKTYSYDAFGRSNTQTTKNDGTTVKTDSYTFTPNGSNTSGQVATHTVASSGLNKTFSYTYDDNGNILTVSDGTYTTSYVYDSQNQLIRENNQKANKTWTWTYDNAGNILKKQEHAYTTGTLGAPTDTVNYAYEDGDPEFPNSGWGDLLTSYDGRSISYDAIGNPISYYDDTIFTWKHGRQLAAIDDWEITYNADGMRTYRGSSGYGAEYEYFYSGDKLVRMEFWEDFGDHLYGTMEFSYDASGAPLAVQYDEKLYSDFDEDGNDIGYHLADSYTGTFYYVTNLQGDVIALVDENGSLVAEYTYDAWGKVLSRKDYTPNHYFAYYNPLRYRGYVYDSEYDLYYLQSRYYDPQIGRFLNADAFVSTGQGFVGSNMYAYCLNNPVRYYDNAGYMSEDWADYAGEEIGKFLYEWITGNDHPSRQTEQLEIQIIQEQNELTKETVKWAWDGICNGASFLWGTYMRGYNMQLESQRLNAELLIGGVRHAVNHPEETIDLTIAGYGVTSICYSIGIAVVSGNPVSLTIEGSILAIYTLYRAVKGFVKTTS